MKTRHILVWSQRVLFTAAFSLLGYCGFVVASTWTFQNRERREFQAELALPPAVGKPPLLLSSGD